MNKHQISLFFVFLVIIFSSGLALIYFSGVLIENPVSINQNIENSQGQLNTLDKVTYSIGGRARGVFVKGDYCYVADESNYLRILNISNPMNPLQIGSRYLDFVTLYDVVVWGDYAFIAAGAQGLAVIDVSDPKNPGAPIYAAPYSAAYDVFVIGEFCYIADADRGLTIYNITDPLHPKRIGNWDTDWAMGVFVSGDFAYLADVLGLKIINISDPFHPKFVITVTISECEHVFVWGDFCYVAAGSYGLAVVNITRPLNPGGPIYKDTAGSAKDLVVWGDYVYIADWGSGMAIINISRPMNPTAPVYEMTSGIADGICIAGNYAYIADFDAGLTVIKIGEMINPTTSYYEDTTSNSLGVAVNGDYCYVADNANGLAVFNIMNPVNPILVAYENTAGDAYKVAVDGDWCYIADGASGLAIINIANPKDPILISTYNSGYTNDLFVYGDLIYVAAFQNSSGRLSIINVTNPRFPSLLGTVAIAGDPQAVFIDGDYAYLTITDGGLVICNITDPRNPTQIGFRDTAGIGYGVFVDGDYAYVALGSTGIGIINISNKTNPEPPVYINPGNAFEVCVAGDYCFVAGWNGVLAIINITNPRVPTIFTTYGLFFGHPWDVVVWGDFAFIADESGGLAIIPIMMPWYALNVPNINPIAINPDFDGNLITVNWDDVNSATIYYIYRETSPIVTMTGRVPLTTVVSSIFLDNVTQNGVYYYAIAAGNGRGKSWVSINVSVTVIIDTTPPGNFSIYSPTDWVTDWTPTVIACFYTSESGIDFSSVYYAYSKNGSETPTNWGVVNGVFTNSGCTNSALDGNTGWLYARVDAVPFNQDANISNKIRFCASDMVGNNGIQANATIIKIDSTSPVNFTIISPVSRINDQTPTVIVKFYEGGCGVDISRVDYAFAKDGSPAPSTFYPVDGIFVNSECSIPAIDGSAGWLFAQVIEVPFNQDSETQNTIRFRASDMLDHTGIQGTASIIRIDSVGPISFSIYSPINWIANQTPTVIGLFYLEITGINISTVEYAYSINGSSTPLNWAGVDGVYTNAECTISAIDGTTGWLYARIMEVPFLQDSKTLNTIRFRAKDTLNNVGIQGIASYIQIDTIPPQTFSIISPLNWINNQTPTIIGRFYTETSGINISTVQYAYSTVGMLDPFNWQSVDGVYTDSACTISAINGQTGWLYVRILAVPFNQDSKTLNTIRFRATDLANLQGNQSTAVIIKIDSSIEAPVQLQVIPQGWTTRNSFNLTWINPVDVSGITGVYYKIGAPPSSPWDGTYLGGINISKLENITVPVIGNNTIYVWLIDETGNCNSTKVSTVFLLLKEPTSFNIFDYLVYLIIILSVAVVAVYGVYRARKTSTWGRIEEKTRTINTALNAIRKKIITKEIEPISPLKLSLDEKLKSLMDQGIPLDSITESYDSELNEFFERSIATLDPAVTAKIMSLNIPEADKVIILEEFKGIAEKYQKEFLKELDRL